MKSLNVRMLASQVASPSTLASWQSSAYQFASLPASSNYYKAQYTVDAIKALGGATEIKVSKEGVTSVTVEDKDPKLAADLANAYVTTLDRLLAKLGTTDASRQRAFITDRLEKTEKALRQAEEALRRFQENNKAIVVQEQAKSAIEEAAKVEGQIVAAEAQRC